MNDIEARILCGWRVKSEVDGKDTRLKKRMKSLPPAKVIVCSPEANLVSSEVALKRADT